MSMPFNSVRFLLLATVVTGVGVGLSVSAHTHRIVASLFFGVATGLLLRSAWTRVQRQSPEHVQQMQRNAAEAQGMLRDSFAWKLGAGRPLDAKAGSLDFEEVLSAGISIVLFSCLAGMVWLLPVFWQSPEAELVAMAKAVGAQFFALCSVAAATFGIVARLCRKSGGALSACRASAVAARRVSTNGAAVDRRTRIFLIICLVAFCSSFLVQTAFQFLGAEKSVWGGNPGWQREIAFWNVGAAVTVFLTLRAGDSRLAIPVAAGCTALFFLLGTNHLFAFITNPHAQFHWPPLVLNYVGLAFGIRLLLAVRADNGSRREG